MSRIRRVFENETAILSFLMGGDPSLAATESLAMAMLGSGAHGLVTAIPFSDPIEGAQGQKAHLRALASGVTTGGLLCMIGRLRDRTDQPILLQAYLNVLYHYGYDSFFAACSQAGVDGLIIPDLPCEEKGELLPFAAVHHIDLIPLIAPTSGGRIKDLLAGSRGFAYLPSLPDPTETVRFTREVTDQSGLPVVIEMPVFEEDRATILFEAADGILWSGALGLIDQYGDEAAQPIREALTAIRKAVVRG
ncbi:MAG: tryptophan synthase subunit alpha [Clostridiaceae bacterium]|nr:tryptophan synthase subunit alpha [Clostridiaceae bacterium]